MAVYQFSALSDGQSLSFDAASDRLNFDQTSIAAGDLTLVQEGTDLRVLVKSGPVAGKDIVLVGTDPTEIATSNFTFADGSVALVGDNSPLNTNDHGANLLNGGAGRDLLMGLGGNDTLNGGDNNDSLVGSLGNDAMNGNNGNDWLEGGEGTDTLTGSGGQDTFIFREYGAGNFNADVLPDFASNWDRIELDASVFNVGAAGRFSTNDARFFAGSAAHDADDRIIFNSAAGQIWYDADGNGSGAQQLIATLGAGRGVIATDFTVIGSAAPPSGGTINGSAGDDTLIGTPGPDTINGLGGNDSIRGGEGADSMNGGDGNDTLDGYNHRTFDTDTDVETLVGGLGNDVFKVDNAGDVISDTGGIDTVFAGNISWTLASGFENLVLDNDESFQVGTGNELDNVIGQLDHGWNMRLEGLAGNDTLLGGFQEDTLLGGDGNDSLDGAEGVDSLDGGAGNDTLDSTILSGDDDFFGGTGADHFSVTTPGNIANRIHDFESGVDKLRLDGNRMQNVGATGNFSVNDARFFAGTAAHDADDRVIWDGSVIWYDPDGTGSAAQQMVAQLQAGATVVATDFEVVNGTGGGQTINGTSGNDSLVGGPGADTMNGFAGNDTLDGGAGGDSMAGGTGNDLYFVENVNDVVVEADNAGIDEVRSSISYTLPDFVNNLTLTGFAQSGTGNDIDNVITGVASGSNLSGLGGNDTLIGGASGDFLTGGTGNDSVVGGAGNDLLAGEEGNDTLLGGDGSDTLLVNMGSTAPWGNDVMDGGGGIDALQFTINSFSPAPVVVDLAAGTVTSSGGNATVANIENVFGTEGADRIVGNALGNVLNGLGGSDTLDGGAGNDTLAGGIGLNGVDAADTFLFTAIGAANADQVNSFQSGLDEIRLDASVMTALGASGDFTAGDARFWSAPGASSGHDADDRIIFNQSTAQLFYDADGSGSGAAQLLATVLGNFVADTDISVINGSSGGGGGSINGTAGNDSLTGTAGNDTINGNAGNDTLRGLAGDDSLDGGSGTDLLDGGTGNDIYVVSSGDTLVDAGGVDQIYSPVSWALGNGFENIELTGSANADVSGNFVANIIVGNNANNVIRGRDGNDTLTGNGGVDFFDFTTAPSAGNADTITDFTSVDQLRFDDAAHAGIGATGTWGAADGRFWASAAGTAHDASDRVVYNTTTGALYYDADGSGAGSAVLVATLQGAPTLAASDITVI